MVKEICKEQFEQIVQEKFQACLEPLSLEMERLSKCIETLDSNMEALDYNVKINPTILVLEELKEETDEKLVLISQILSATQNEKQFYIDAMQEL